MRVDPLHRHLDPPDAFEAKQQLRLVDPARLSYDRPECLARVLMARSERSTLMRWLVHISNDSSVMLPSSFGITRWCRRAIQIPFGDLTHHCSVPSGRIIRP